jgi:hypothetical protein
VCFEHESSNSITLLFCCIFLTLAVKSLHGKVSYYGTIKVCLYLKMERNDRLTIIHRFIICFNLFCFVFIILSWIEFKWSRKVKHLFIVKRNLCISWLYFYSSKPFILRNLVIYIISYLTVNLTPTHCLTYFIWLLF